MRLDTTITSDPTDLDVLVKDYAAHHELSEPIARQQVGEILARIFTNMGDEIVKNNHEQQLKKKDDEFLGSVAIILVLFVLLVFNIIF